MDSGAHFHKCDFQVHSPRDAEWVGARPVSDDDRRKYAEQFVAACRDKGLQAVAITDHHDCAFFDFIREAAATEVGEEGEPLPKDQRLIVFPGLELTLAVPCQALLILDAEFPTERLSSVLERLAIEQTDASSASHEEPQQLAHIENLKSLHEELDKSSWLKSHYIVLPNLTDGGHKTLMRKGMHDKYREMPCVGGYIDGDLKKKVGTGNARIFKGLDSKWGNKRVALVQTSDSRAESFEHLGRFSTWVKWATPTAEALRQACLAEESRIDHNEPELPSVALTRLSVSNSRFMGPIEVELNPQYNAVIGGRGTGKSTCLEYIRWALCDQPPKWSETDDVPDLSARRRRLIAETLQPFESHIDVHFLVNGIPHAVRRSAKTGDVLVRVGAEEFKPASPDEIRSLLPVEAYSQRQLSSVAVRVEELTRFVTAPIRGQLEEIRSREVSAAGQVRENYASLQRQRTLTRNIARDSVTVESLAQQASNLRGGLVAVSEEDRVLLARKPAFDAADELVLSWERRTSQFEEEAVRFGETVLRLRSQTRKLAADEEVPERETLAALERALDELAAEVESAAHKAEDAVRASGRPDADVVRLIRSWREAHEAFETSYGGAKDRSAAHATKLEELAALEERRRQLQSAVETQREELAGLGEPQTKHDRLLGQWLKIQSERSDTLEKQCVALTKLSEGLIRARIERGAGLKELGERFRAAITGSGVRGAKVDAFLAKVESAEDSLAAWQKAMADLEGYLLTVDDPTAHQWRASTALDAFAESDMERISAKLDPEQVLELSLIAVDDHPIFEYQTKPGEYIAFEVASAGQQATALLRVLLNQAGPPLIVDQPEDDLDSQVILDVVDRIWKAKTRRQLIFSSHNANLVVNGDAELVICCDYRAAGDHSGGRIKLKGAIDVDDVREEITVVMEGGEKAFRLRKDKYGF